MSKLLAIFALAALASWVAIVSADVYEREGHLHDLRKRLGHFKEQPFTDLYAHYAAVFVYPHHPERDADDYRNYMPSADECVIYLKKFRSQKFELRDLDQMIPLDGCLGYLYDEGAQVNDEERKELKQFAEFPELKELYAGAHVNELNEESKECVADLLMNTLKAKNQFKNVVCNNHFLQVFLQFAECQSGQISSEQRASDSYLKMLYQLVRDRVNECVDIESTLIENALRHEYAKKKVTRLSNSLKARISSLIKEEKNRMWPSEVTRLLAAFQNTTDQVNIREVHRLIRGVAMNDETLKQILLNNMAQFATKTLKPKFSTKVDPYADDRKGMTAYKRLIDSMCNYFRSSDRESEYDFATPIIRLNQLLAHQDLFDITPELFVQKFLTRARETAPVYLSVAVCNILTYTDGIIGDPSTSKKQFYNVVFKPDTKGMILWPNAGYN